MIELTTTQCYRFKHPELSITFRDRDIALDDAQALLESIQGMIAGGATFAPSDSLQVGWLNAQFRRGRGHLLTLYEPDLRAPFFSWVPGVSNILITQRLQLDVAEHLGLRERVDFARYVQSCVVCTQLKDSPDFTMCRSPSNHASGWVVTCLGRGHDHDDPANRKCMSIYELVTRISSAALPYLALPMGIALEFDGGHMCATLDGKPLALAPHPSVDAHPMRHAHLSRELEEHDA